LLAREARSARGDERLPACLLALLRVGGVAGEGGSADGERREQQPRGHGGERGEAEGQAPNARLGRASRGAGHLGLLVRGSGGDASLAARRRGDEGASRRPALGQPPTWWRFPAL